MGKLLLNCSMIFFVLTAFSLADMGEVKLKEKYGKTLTQAPFFLKYAFNKKYHKDWKNTDYADRKSFLINYENNLKAEQDREKEKVKQKAQEEKERKQKLTDDKRRQAERLKAEHDRIRTEQQAERERQRAFNDQLRGQKETLRQLEQSIRN